MAASNRILCLNLGTQTVGLGEFKTGHNGGLVLTNYKTSELLADPALPDATRLAQTKLTLSEMVANLGYGGHKIHFAISSQAIFTRFVKLPSVGEEQVDQIVGVDINPSKRSIATKLGMTHFVNPREIDGELVGYLVELTKGGADYTFECTGNINLMRQALECCRDIFLPYPAIHRHAPWNTHWQMQSNDKRESLPIVQSFRPV